MKTFASLNHLTLLATLTINPMLYSSQASRLSSLSSSSSSSASSGSSARASSTSSSSTQTSTALQEGVDNSQRASETHTSHPQSQSLFSFIYSFSSWLLPGSATKNNTSTHQEAATVEASSSYSAKELFELGKKHQTEIYTKIYAEPDPFTTDKSDAPAQCSLAWCCCHASKSVPAYLMPKQWFIEVVRFFTLAANQGYAPAQYDLARCYANDEGVPTNLTQEQRITKVVELYILAANQNFAPAQLSLARCYLNNEGVPTNLTQKQRLTKAVEHYTSAAKQDYAPAQFDLACCYLNNEGVPTNFTQDQREIRAVELFTRAAKQGHTNAQHNLACCYEKGIGIKQDLTKALKFYRLNAKQGHWRAQITVCKAFQKGLLPKTEEFQKLADSCRTQLGWKLGSEQAAREAIEEETIALHNKIPLYCQGEPCAICFKEFGPLQKITILPCYHTFCPNCIQGWLDTGHETCPTCRQRTTERFTALVMKKEAKPAQPESKESKEKKS